MTNHQRGLSIPPGIKGQVPSPLRQSSAQGVSGYTITETDTKPVWVVPVVMRKTEPKEERGVYKVRFHFVVHNMNIFITPPENVGEHTWRSIYPAASRDEAIQMWRAHCRRQAHNIAMWNIVGHAEGFPQFIDVDFIPGDA